MGKHNFGFIILRHVTTPDHNKLWIECYRCIRNFYKDETIVIIDDNSNYKYITQQKLHNTIVVDSEYKLSGELLPFVYYAKNKWFSKAIILHDSVFLQQPFDNVKHVKHYKYLWEFPARHAIQLLDQEVILQSLKNNYKLLLNNRNSSSWKGCFGGMMIIDHKFLVKVDQKYKLYKMIDFVKTRYNRQSFERVIGIILHTEKPKKDTSLFGSIVDYCKWGITLDQYFLFYKDNNHFPVVKVWSSR